MEIHRRNAEPWKVTLVDTGEATLTGGRLARVRDFLDDTFCFTYGDGVADVDVAALIAHHHAEGRQATLTAVQPPGRYGALGLDGNQVHNFQQHLWVILQMGQALQTLGQDSPKACASSQKSNGKAMAQPANYR